jgi:predicted metalloendopeptidase
MVRKHFNEKAKLAMEEMVRDIRVEFDTILSQIGWMDEKTRKRAKVTDILTFPWRRW